MAFIHQLKEKYLGKQVQFILFDFDGNLLESCDSLFKTKNLAQKSASSWFPMLESILFSLTPDLNDELYFPKIKAPFEHLPGIYDFYFNVVQEAQNLILWRIYDYSSFYESILHYQQKLNELLLSQEQKVSSFNSSSSS